MDEIDGAFLNATGLTWSEFAELSAQALERAQGAEPSRVQILDSTANGVSAATAGIVTVGAETRAKVKAIQRGDAEFPKWSVSAEESHPFYWAREAQIYRNSKSLATDAPLRLPQTYMVVSCEGRRLVQLIFMEDIVGLTGQDLGLSRNVLVARHLGHAQGQYALRFACGDPSLRAPWWSRTWLDEYCKRSEQFEMTHRNDAHARNHRLLERFRLRSLDDRLLAAWDDRGTLLAHLHHLPQTIVHNDLWPRQYIAPDGPGRGPETVLLDPAFMGWGPLGLDAGNLATELCAGRPRGADPDVWDEVASLMFESYLLGLGDAGLYIDDPDLRAAVRLAFTGGQAARNAYRIGEWLRVAAGVTEGVATQRQWLDMGIEDAEGAFAVYQTYGETIMNYYREANELVKVLHSRDTLCDPSHNLTRWAKPDAVKLAKQVAEENAMHSSK